MRHEPAEAFKAFVSDGTIVGGFFSDNGGTPDDLGLASFATPATNPTFLSQLGQKVSGTTVTTASHTARSAQKPKTDYTKLTL